MTGPVAGITYFRDDLEPEAAALGEERPHHGRDLEQHRDRQQRDHDERMGGSRSRR